jgi:large subunit ribosomal protein L3
MQTEMGLLAKKIGMTQLFREDGTRVPVTVLSCGGNVVTAHRTVERDGYTALQLAFDEVKATRVNKPNLGQFKASNAAPRRFVRELRVLGDLLGTHPVGSEVAPSIFEEGAIVDVTATSKGKGFQGVMKRHNMEGEKATHGQHEYFRHGGSVGCRKTPGRVFPGKRMSGHMGAERVTVQNLRVEKVLAEQGLILVHGSIPGANDGYVMLRHSVKAAARKRHAAVKATKK